MNFNQSHDPSDVLGEEEPQRVSDVLSQSIIYSKIVQHRLLSHPEYKADPIGAYQRGLALLLKACHDRAFEDLASSLH